MRPSCRTGAQVSWLGHNRFSLTPCTPALNTPTRRPPIRPLSALFAALLSALGLTACQHATRPDNPHTPARVLQEAEARLARQAASGSPAPAGVLPLFTALQAQPLQAAYRVGLVEDALRRQREDAHALMRTAFNLGGVTLHRPASAIDALASQILSTPDPLASGLEHLAMVAGMPAQDVVPPGLPDALRDELAVLLASLARVEGYRQRALQALPDTLDPATLIRQALDGEMETFESPDFRLQVSRIEYPALAAGMLDLVAAAQRIANVLRHTPDLPALRWEAPSPLGRILIDTTGKDNPHRLADTLLLIDTAGNDHYLAPDVPQPGITLLIDLAGDDCYQGATGALLGYSLILDLAGNDHHGRCPEATTGTTATDAVTDAALPRLTQAAALFGAALLIDEQGDDHYHARSHAQAWALGGVALLLDRAGHDRHHALAFAQGSAGPYGVALLFDTDGDDHYTLAATPLVHPSSQLPDRNVSMGQGAGMGLRAEFSDGRSLPGGLGMLLDLAGNDHYEAQVFAQGAGYYQGTGLLIDGGGQDTLRAAWYGMAAAAHQGVGILLKRGAGNDHYHASHATSLAAAHDRSLALLIDEGGDDHYHLGHLGLGTAHDNGVALFADLDGQDHYHTDSATCLAFGASHLNDWGSLREALPNIGLFFDLGGTDHYPAHCAHPGNDRPWTWPFPGGADDLPSAYGRGLDGTHPPPYPLPLHTRPRTHPVAPAH